MTGKAIDFVEMHGKFKDPSVYEYVEHQDYYVDPLDGDILTPLEIRSGSIYVKAVNRKLEVDYSFTPEKLEKLQSMIDSPDPIIK
jgi:hypothetical protein